MIDIIKVKATNTDGRVVIWEKDPSHPIGEIFVSGDGSVTEVANTAAVRAAIKAGALVQVQPEVTKAPAKQEADAVTINNGNSVVITKDVSAKITSSQVTIDTADHPTFTDKSAERVKPAKR